MGVVSSKTVPTKYSKQISGRKRNALWVGFAFAVIPLIIIITIYYNLYKPITLEEPEPDNSIIDTVDIVSTLCIVFSGYCILGYISPRLYISLSKLSRSRNSRMA